MALATEQFNLVFDSASLKLLKWKSSFSSVRDETIILVVAVTMTIKKIAYAIENVDGVIDRLNKLRPLDFIVGYMRLHALHIGNNNICS